MAEITGRIGNWKIKLGNGATIPHDSSGSTWVDIEGKGRREVRWLVNKHGIWLEFDGAVHGFSFERVQEDEGRASYRISRCGKHSDGAESEWSGLNFIRSNQEESAGISKGAKTSSTRIRGQMPGKIIRVFATEGAVVEKDQSLAVMEAMKMENEIKAPHRGKIEKVFVSEGQAVETGAPLFMLHSE